MSAKHRARKHRPPQSTITVEPWWLYPDLRRWPAGRPGGVIGVIGVILILLLTRGWSALQVASVLTGLAPVLVSLVLCATVAAVAA